MEKKDIDVIRAATAAGVQDAIADPDTWRSGFSAMQEGLTKAAQAESGKWLLGWFGWLFRKFVFWVVVVGVLYFTGGLPAVMAWLKAKQ